MISDINIRVDRDKCYACGICVERCILDNLRLSVAPCRTACPIHMNCQGYIRLLAQGNEEDAAKVMRQCSPFGAILGRICSHPCEEVCERSPIDGPVHIRALKRYLADSFPDVAYSPPENAKETGQRVAVIGSGPAGLTVAYELQSRGHGVTVYEGDTEPGGLLRWAIPSFRLPVQEVEHTISMLQRMGINFKVGTALVRDLDIEDLKREYGAVILALGGGKSKCLSIPGEDLEGVIDGLDLLRKIKANERLNIGESVVVIGGGNSAVDTALTCVRLGSEKVQIVSLEGPLEMPAFALEIQEAKEEGIIFKHSYGPRQFFRLKDGRIRIDFSQCLSLLDENECFNPLLKEECELSIDADTVVVAIGQEFTFNDLSDSFFDPANGFLVADPLTYQSPSDAQVFVCGDAFSGPKSVVDAIGSAQETAISADRFLNEDGLRWGRGFWNGANVKEYEIHPDRAKGGSRGKLGRVPVKSRTLNEEVEKTLSSLEAKKEAERCLSCGRAFEMNKTCWFCLPCEIECPVDALEVRMPYLVR